MKRIYLLAIVVCLALCCPIPAGAQKATPASCPENELISGTGDAAGTFGVMFQNIRSVCSQVCEYKDEEGKPSTGGFMNVGLLTKKKIDLGMVPEDVLELSKRTDPLVAKSVRVLSVLHFNTLHIIVLKKGTDVKGQGYLGTSVGASTQNFFIEYLHQLKGKRVAVFASALVTANFINERLGYNIEPIEVKTKEEGFALLDKGEAFAFMTTGGWPIGWVDKADSTKYTLANVSDADLKRLGAPYYPVKLNYQTLGVYGVNTFGARNVIAVWDYTSPARIKQITDFKECFTSKLPDIKEMRGAHPSWTDVEDTESAEVLWPKYNPVATKSTTKK
jgi:TRAP-type uncharacterized transport system substrate-binding protein